jgi:cyclohexanone monooxygenase
VTVSVPHALNEQAKHATYILDQARRRGATTVEVTLEAEEWWQAEIQAKARLGVRFYAECTPGYYNNEGQPGNPNGLFSGNYGAGPLPFFKLLDEWRATGTMPGELLDGEPL